ncbi:hypothetical protein XENOCAPTIV_020667, partial [Xenoophorus captivus]
VCQGSWSAAKFSAEFQTLGADTKWNDKVLKEVCYNVKDELPVTEYPAVQFGQKTELARSGDPKEHCCQFPTLLQSFFS